MSPQIAWREIKGDGRLDLPMTSSFSPLCLPSTSSGLYLHPHVWPLHTHNFIYLSKWKWIQIGGLCQQIWRAVAHGRWSGQTQSMYMLEHYGGNLDNINLLIKKQSFNLKSKTHSWNKPLKMNNKISLLLVYFNGLSPPDSQKNTSEMKWFAVIVSCSMNIHNGVCI